MIWNYYFKTVLFLSIIIVIECTIAPTDPELLEQLWNQLYRYLPGLAIAPKSSADHALNIKLSVSVNNLQLIHSTDQYLCRASITLMTEWSVTDSRVTESSLIDIAGGSVRLDVNKVWHPQIVIIGAYEYTKLYERLELRANYPLNDNGITKSTIGLNSAAAPNNGNRVQTMKDSNAQSGRSHTRTKNLKVHSDIDGLNYAFIESVVVEVPCQEPKAFNHISSILCPIWIKQEGYAKTQPSIKWAERKECLISEAVNRQASYLSITKRYEDQVDLFGPDQSLGINICFSLTGKIFQGSLPPLVFVVVAFFLLWTNQMGTSDMSWAQLILFLCTIIFWSWLGTQQKNGSKYPGFLNIWCLICTASIGLIYLFVIIHYRLACRFLKHRYQRFDRGSYISRTKSKHSNLLTNTMINERLQTCGCCNTCTEPCANCIAARTSTGFVSSNGTAGCCSNSSCGLSGNSGHVCTGLPNLAGGGVAANGPTQMGFSPNMNMSANKMDNYGESFICPGNSELTNTTNGGTFRGIRWRSTKRDNVGLLGIDLSQAECHLCQSNHHHQHQNHNSPAPPYTSVCSFDISSYPSNYCLTVLRTLCSLLFCIVSAVFWISVLAQGTVPDECLGPSVCQLITMNNP